MLSRYESPSTTQYQMHRPVSAVMQVPLVRTPSKHAHIEQ